MASTKIDELQLQISSDASTAIGQLNDLASALDNAAASAASLSRANGALNVFASSLARIAGTDLTQAINNLEKLSHLDLSNLKDKSFTIDLTVNGADRVDRLRYATDQAAKAASKNSAQIAKDLGKDYKMDTGSVKEMTSQLGSFVDVLRDGGDTSTVMDAITENIAENTKKASADILGNRKEIADFVDYVNKTQIAPSKNVSSDAKNYWKSLGLERNYDKVGGIGIDTLWQSEDFRKVASGFVNLGLTNPEDMFWELGAAMESGRASMNEYSDSAETFAKIQSDVKEKLAGVTSAFNENVDKNMAKTNNAIPLELGIDIGKFRKQIQDAIYEVTKTPFESHPIQVKLDTEHLKQNLEHVISLVDFGKLPQAANGFNTMASAMSAMNQVNLKNTGISQFSNALRRLMSVDTSKFNPTALYQIVDVITSVSKLNGIDKTINRFVSALTKLANVGYRTKTTADGLKALGPVLKDTVKKFIDIGTIDGKINQFVAGLASLASAGGTTAVTAQHLDALTKAVLRFLKTVRNAPQISTNLAMTIQGLGNLAAAGVKTSKALGEVGSAGNRMNSSLNAGLSKAATSLANSFKKVLQIVLKLGGSGVKALGSFMQKIGLLPSASAGIDRTAISFGNLLRAIVPFYGIRGLFDWAKGAAEAGSSIVEVENVINTSFGSLKKGYDDVSGYIYRWAEGTIDAFGVSELAAKQYAGRLMAMFNSSGFDLTEGMRDSAAKMTTDLIERAGDIASFYDIGVDEAMTKMQAGLAGQVRPLRALGINMSVANMEAFALSQGINTSWKEMDQASQMALRYQYILYATQYAEGDFAKTSMSMANQVRLLQLNFQMLSTTIGQGLVSAIAPVISWLNALIKRLIQAANAFRTFMWTLFGKPLAAAKGVANEMATYMDDASDSASDLGGAGGSAGDGLGSAADSAKELKKNLSVLPFDELNQLAKDTDSASSGGSGGSGGGGGGIGGIGDLGLSDLSDIDIDSSPTVEAINRWAARIREAFEKHQWANLGRIVAEGINAGFQYIYDVLDWEKLKPKIVDGFITPFQTAFNSMMTWIDWSLVGQTFARGLNDVVYTLRAWITGFDWKAYGGYFAEGLNSMINGWDADAFGRLIADKFKMAWDFFGGWVEDFNFASLGSKLKIGFTSFLDELDPAEMGDSLADFLNGLADMIIAFFEDDDVVTDMSDAFSEFVNNFLETLDSEKLSQAISTITEALKKTLKESIKKIDKSELATDLGNVLSALPWGTIALVVGAKAGASLAIGIFGSAFKAKATEIISGLMPKFGSTGGTTTGATTGGGASAGAGIVSATGMSAGSLLAGTGIMGGLMALGVAMRKFADAHGGVEKGANLTTDQSFGTTQTAQKAQNSAGYSTQVQTQPITTSPEVSKVQQIVETILTGKKDQSFANLEMAKASLMEVPIVKKIMDGVSTRLFDTAYTKFTDTKLYNVVKTFFGSESGGFLDKFSKYIYTKAHNVTKWFNGNESGGFLDKYFKYVFTGNKDVTKTFYGKDGGWFVYYSSKYASIVDKTVKVTMNIVTTAKKVVASLVGGVKETLANIWTENAKGGLFTRATGFQVFGEAGAEAAIPLERKSTMKRIASAIVDSGGMATGNSAELANEIAMRVAPIIMSAVSAQNERPVNVNATLYTEDNEVLARAVNQGNRSLDKRYNPVTQYSY